MQPSLHIVATCTDRKALAPSVRLRDIRGRSIDQRFEAWERAIRTAHGERSSAAELYQGGYWAVVRGLTQVASAAGWTPQLWVSSAGYGVVRDSQRMVPYSATFASGHPDSVDAGSRDGLATAKWWAAVTSGKHRLGRTVASIASAEPRSTVLLLASPAYLAAMADDLIRASTLFKGRGGLFIVSSKVPAAYPSLAASWIRSTASLQGALGGGLVSLHARVARHLLRTMTPHAFLTENLATMSQDLEKHGASPRARQAGSPMTDEEVVAFIRAELKRASDARHTRLLRELRNSGRACEQARFRRLFNQVKP